MQHSPLKMTSETCMYRVRYMYQTHPSAKALKTLLCSVGNKERLQKLICSHLTDLAQNVNAEIVYSVGPHCINLSTQQPMEDYSIEQSEADTILFIVYGGLRQSDGSGSGGRAGQPMTHGSAVRIPAPPVYMSKCPWARH